MGRCQVKLPKDGLIFDRDAPHWWALISALTDKADSQVLTEVCEKHPDHYEVLFSVNGVELDFVHVMKQYEAQFQRCVNARAQKLLQERCNDLETRLGDAIDDARREMSERLYDDE